ncbi:MAG: hypothetical protein U0270_35200 [Labilithrix sp.]
MRRLAVPAALVAAAWLGACGSFGADAAPKPGADGGAEAGEPTDATTAGPMPFADAGPDAQPPIGTLPAFECKGNVIPLVPITFDAVDFPSGWSQVGTKGASDKFEVTNARYSTQTKGGYLHARVTTNALLSKGPTILRSDLGTPKKVRVAYDLSVKSLATYSELGCQLEITSDTDEDELLLYVGVEKPLGQGLIIGWDEIKGGTLNNVKSDTRLPGWKADVWQRVVMEATIDGAAVAGWVSIDGMTKTAFELVPKTGFTVEQLHVRCGAIYIEPSGEQTLDLAIDGIEIQRCDAL